MDDQLKQLYDILPNCSCDDFKSAVKKIQSMADDENFLDACLLRAADYERLDIISLIYEDFDHPYMGREECFPNCASETPLLLAARRGNFEIVKYLLEHKANPFAVDSHGCNAAMNAIASGNVELAKFLIEDCKIAWQGYTWEGTSALQFAVSSRSPRMFGYILSLGGLQYNHPKYEGQEGVDDYPLLRFAGYDRHRSAKQTKMLNGKFKQILKNYQTKDCSEICEVAEQNMLDKVQQLVNSYEYPIISDLVVCAACKGGSLEIFHYFTDMLHLPVPENALAYAVTGANEELVSELIYEHEQNIYQTTSQGETLLHLAVKNGHWRSDMDPFRTLAIICTDLLEWGRLDPNAVSHAGAVLDLACLRGELKVIEILVSFGAVIDADALCAAARRGNLDVLKFLLEKNTNLSIHARGQNGTTLLHEAIKGKAYDMITYLLTNGLSVDVADNDGVTAKDCASSLHVKLVYPVVFHKI